MANSNLKDVLTGEVVSIDDPTYSGRIKVRVKGLNDNIEVENLPWVSCNSITTFSGDAGGNISIPKVGARVRVRFKKDDPNSMEWCGLNRIDRDLAAELAADYEGSHVLLYDSSSELSIMYQNSTGLRLYYKGSFIQISPDNNITINYSSASSGTMIQLSDGVVNVQGNSQINITSGNTVKVEANSIILNGSQNVQIKGSNSGDVAVNGKELYKVLMNMARLIDQKVPATGGICADLVSASKSSILNQQIQYI